MDRMLVSDSSRLRLKAAADLMGRLHRCSGSILKYSSLVQQALHQLSQPQGPPLSISNNHSMDGIITVLLYLY